MDTTNQERDAARPPAFIDLALIEVKNANSALSKAIDGIGHMTLPELLLFYRRVNAAHEALDKERKKISAQLKHLSYSVIPDRMESENVKTMTLEDADGKFRFTVSRRLSASMLDKAAGMQWLRDHGHGDLIVETVNAGTLSAAAKSILEEGFELPDDLFKVSHSPNISVTRA